MNDNGSTNGKLERKQKQVKVVKAMLEIENIYEYLSLEREHNDQIKVKRMYIDMAGDLISGILLGQILYWWTPKKDGSLKVSVEHNGKLWIAKGRKEWWEEIRITSKQFDRACQILKGKGLIETTLKHWNGYPTKHVRPNESNILQGVKSILTKGKNATSPLVKMEVNQTSKSNLPKGENASFIAKITSKNTQKMTSEREKRALAGEPFVRICTRFHDKENPDYFKWINIFNDEFAYLEKNYAANGDTDDLWAAFEDLENNIEAAPENPNWKKSHFALLKKYLDVALRKQQSGW